MLYTNCMRLQSQHLQKFRSQQLVSYVYSNTFQHKSYNSGGPANSLPILYRFMHFILSQHPSHNKRPTVLVLFTLKNRIPFLILYRNLSTILTGTLTFKKR